MNKAGDDIVFLCGALRSGTTPLTLMLGHHPQIADPGELDFLFECRRAENGAPDVASESFPQQAE